MILTIIVGVVCIFVGIGITCAVDSYEEAKEKRHPTKYQTGAPRLALELHRGKAVVILATATDKTILPSDTLFALSDELRKYHTTAESVNVVIQPDINADESTASIPEVIEPEPTPTYEHTRTGTYTSDIYRVIAENPTLREAYSNAIASPTYRDLNPAYREAYMNWVLNEARYRDTA